MRGQFGSAARYAHAAGELRSAKEGSRGWKARSSRWIDWIGRASAIAAAVAALTCAGVLIDNPTDNLELSEAVELAAYTTGGAAMVNVATRSRKTSEVEQQRSPRRS